MFIELSMATLFLMNYNLVIFTQKCLFQKFPLEQENSILSSTLEQFAAYIDTVGLKYNYWYKHVNTYEIYYKFTTYGKWSISDR